jgi:hypothetical protein
MVVRFCNRPSVLELGSEATPRDNDEPEEQPTSDRMDKAVSANLICLQLLHSRATAYIYSLSSGPSLSSYNH